MKRSIKAGLGLFFFLSGATGLLYEIVWMRQLILVFGSTTYAVSAVLSAFMLGLALGSFAFGRAADRGRNLIGFYGLLEVGVGLYALVAPFLLGSLAPLFVRVLGADPAPGAWTVGARLLGSLVILLPPTILMGGTLPVLSRVFSDPGEEHAGPVGRLYALNTFGAVAGTFFTGFILLPAFGMHRTTLGAAAVNIALGGAALVLSRFSGVLGRVADGSGLAAPAAPGGADSLEPLSPAPRAAPAAGPRQEPQLQTTRAPGSGAATRGAAGAADARAPNTESAPASASVTPAHWLVLATFALSGFAAMLYEVGWTRVLALTIGSSVYGFTLMLIAFLVGLAAGAALLARYAARKDSRPTEALAVLLAGIGVASWATSFLFQRLPYLFARLAAWSNGSNIVLYAAELGLCLMIMFPATLLMGGVFPLVLRLHAGHETALGRRVGEAYAANTLGTVVGSAAAGFLLLPALGIRLTLLAAVCIDVLAAGAVLAFTRRRAARRLLAMAAAVLGCWILYVASPAWDRLMMSSGVYNLVEDLPPDFSRQSFLDIAVGQDDVVYYKDGVISTVMVGRNPKSGNLYLKVNGKADASTGIDMRTQILLGQLPLLFHPEAKDVLVIGLASGITVASAATHPVAMIRVLEVEPAMLEACRTFDHFNRNILDDPRVHVVLNDARNDISLRDESYDVIISEPSNPWMTVASNLFTQEFFEAASRRLRDDGVFCQWFQVYSLSPDDLRSLIATFRSVFPNLLVFGVGDASDIIVLGSRRPLVLDYRALQESMSELLPAMDLARAEVRAPENVLAYLFTASPEVDDYLRGATINTDDNALIEFSAPLSLSSETIWTNLRQILLHHTPVAERVRNLPDDPSKRRDSLMLLAKSLLAEHRARAALEALEAAEKISRDATSEALRSTITSRIR